MRRRRRIITAFASLFLFCLWFVWPAFKTKATQAPDLSVTSLKQPQLASQPQTHLVNVPKKTAVIAPQVTTDTSIAPAPPVVKPVQDEIASLVKPVSDSHLQDKPVKAAETPVDAETRVDYIDIYRQAIHAFLNREGYGLTYLQHHLPEESRIVVDNLAKWMALYKHSRDPQCVEFINFCLKNLDEAFPLVRKNYYRDRAKKDDGEPPFLMATLGTILKFSDAVMDSVSKVIKTSIAFTPFIGVPSLNLV